MSDKSNLITHYSSILFGAAASLSFSELVSLCFLLIGLATFIVNWYYKHKDYQLKQAHKKIVQQQSIHTKESI